MSTVVVSPTSSLTPKPGEQRVTVVLVVVLLCTRREGAPT
jgi:hypothetical protein